MDFKYSTLPAKPDGAFPDRRAIRRPILQVSLEHEGKTISTWALVDSGADFCIFPASIGHALGIAIPNQNATPFSGTADAPQIAYFAKLRASIWNGDWSYQPLSFDLYAGFCDTLEHVGLGLLGQDGFFSRFKISFDHAGNLITIA